MSAAVHECFRACLLAGAIGDALGAPIEFDKLPTIRRNFGNTGLHDYVPGNHPPASITDDTQMTLFTAEGLLRAHVRGHLRGITSYAGVTHHAYLRWLATQGIEPPREIGRDGWLWPLRALHEQRAPGNTCLAALLATRSLGEPADNGSKGCGGVMRAAPVGLYAWHRREDRDVATLAYDTARELAALTHGHPDGQAPAGVLAVLMLRLVEGVALREALVEARALAARDDRCRDTLAAIDSAVALADSTTRPGPEAVESLGRGWVAEEALAIGLYCALVAGDDLERGLVLAINHGGDSDSTGSIAGNLLGAALGLEAIPPRWLEPLELRAEITAMADDLWACGTWDIDEYGGADNDWVSERYPGW
jgi:ADP-ribosylglycohydrolase